MKTVKLGEVLELKKGFIEISDREEYNRITVKIHTKGIVPRDKVKGLEIKTKRQQVCKANDFIVAEIDAKVGGYGIIPDELDGGIVSSHYFLFKINESLLKRDFLDCYIKTSDFFKQVRAEGTTNYAAIRPKDVLGYEIPLPDLATQKKIVSFIHTNKSKINSLQSLISSQLDLLKKYRQAILQDAIQGKLVKQDKNDEPASVLLEKIKKEKQKLIAEGKLKTDKELTPIDPDEVPFEIPKNWVWVRFNEIADIKSNLVDTKLYPNNYHIAPDNIEKNTGRLLDYRTVREDGVNSANHYFYPNHIIYSKIRPYLSKVIIVDFEGLCSADMYPIYTYVNIRYLHFTMLTDFFIQSTTSFDTRVAMPKINQEQLNSIILPLPPLAEQKRIVARVDELMTLCDTTEEKLKEDKALSEKMMEAVLQEAFGVKEELPKSKVVSLQEQKNRKREISLRRQALSTRAISEFHDKPGFGNVFLQKVIYLCEHEAELDLDSNYERYAAGPYDSKMMHSLSAQLSKTKWVKVTRFAKGAGYAPLSKIDEYKKLYSNQFSKEQKDKIDLAFQKIKKIGKLDKERIEIVATLYGAWNDLLLSKNNFSDTNIINEVWNHWDKSKQKIPMERWEKALQWMKDNEFTPHGVGKILKGRK